MNPGTQALEMLVQMGYFSKGSVPDSGAVQYCATKVPSKRDWKNSAGLIHKAASWVGKRGLSVTCGRDPYEVVYFYRAKEDI